MEAVIRDDAQAILAEAVPGFDAVAQQFFQAPPAPRHAHDTQQLEKLVDALPDPGVRRLFVDLVRRRGEVDQDTDTELWVIQKYEGG